MFSGPMFQNLINCYCKKLCVFKMNLPTFCIVLVILWGSGDMPPGKMLDAGGLNVQFYGVSH